MFAQVALLATVLALAVAAPQYGRPAPSYQPAPVPSYQPALQQRGYSQPSYPDTPPKYTYDYAVQDGNSGVDLNQQESRNGHNTQGAYYVALPDGRRQKVTYFVDGDSGYVAEVSYEGEAQYPEQQSYQPAPILPYQPAQQPSYQPAPQPNYG